MISKLATVRTLLFVCGMVFGGLAAVPAAADLVGAAPGHDPVSIDSVRVRQSPERTRLVFDLGDVVQHNVFLLDNPERLVIDIENARLNASLRDLDLSDTPVLSVRTAMRNDRDLRVVLDLSAWVKPQSFLLKPILQYGNRLVIDLYTSEQLVTPVVSESDRIARQMRDVIVAIDAGHGGDDPGAIGYGNVREKDVALAIARELEALVAATPGYQPLMIRKKDYYIALRKRTSIARDNKVDLFVSIHADAFMTDEAKGASVYAISQQGASSEQAQWLAEKENRADLIGGVDMVSLDDKDDLLAGVLLDLSMTATLNASLDVGQEVLRSLKGVTRLHKPQVEQAGFAVLKSPDVPSILVETGYISNPDDATYLKNRTHQKKLAAAIFQGISRYMDRNSPPGSFLAWKKQGEHDLVKYRIVRGDTLSEIAEKHRVSPDNLRKINGLTTDTIRVGQVIQIPAS